jgi:hypothetical protein
VRARKPTAAPHLLEDELLQHGLEGRVERLLDVLAEHGRAEPDGVLELLQVVALSELNHDQVLLALLVLDPLLRLRLWVDAQRPPPPTCTPMPTARIEPCGRVWLLRLCFKLLYRTRHDDRVLDRKPVRWQAEDVPLPHDHLQ